MIVCRREVLGWARGLFEAQNRLGGRRWLRIIYNAVVESRCLTIRSKFLGIGNLRAQIDG